MNYKTILLAPFLLSALSFSGAPVLAEDLPPAYYQAGASRVSVEETFTGAAFLPPVQLRASEKNPLVLGLVNGGLAAWKVFSSGAPSGEASSAYASAIPPGMANNWSSVADWKGPKEQLYTYTVTNRLGMDVIKVKYAVSFYYGGTGKTANSPAGSYIANFTVRPVSLEVKWGWHFDMDVVMSDPMNIGTVQRPVALMQADLKWRVSTMLSKDGEVGIWTYSIDGNGNFKDLTSKLAALTKDIHAPAAAVNPAISWN
ncbi:MAG TPA: hypothetical protein DCZ92_05440 [Elusimicrobia bacterium]|nr:hypothetical protein [Elusimicrobiota bacterium]